MSANSDIANSPAISSLETTFVDSLVRGDRRENIGAAAACAAVYGIFMFAALINAIREKHRTHLILVLFGAIRVVAFSVRAYMIDHLSQNLAIVYEVFFAVGFVAIIKVLVSLLTAWTTPDSRSVSKLRAQQKGGLGLSLLRSHGTLHERFTFVALVVGAVCSIIGSTDAYNSSATLSEYNKGLTLMRAGYTIYLAVIVIFCLLVLYQPCMYRFHAGKYTDERTPRAANFALLAFILELCGLVMTVKSVFQVIAIYVNPSLTFKNKLFYPLEVLPELLVFLILVIPGVVSAYLRPTVPQEKHTYDSPAYDSHPTGAINGTANTARHAEPVPTHATTAGPSAV